MVFVKPFKSIDSTTWLNIHHAAIRAYASEKYSLNIIDEWAPDITAEEISKVAANPDCEIRFIAELNGEPVGIGALVVANSELRACYVSPQGARRGVGKAIVREIEQTARKHNLTELTLDASINAEPFYKACGYKVIKYGKHIMPSGNEMACVNMWKAL